MIKSLKELGQRLGKDEKDLTGQDVCNYIYNSQRDFLGYLDFSPTEVKLDGYFSPETLQLITETAYLNRSRSEAT